MSFADARREIARLLNMSAAEVVAEAPESLDFFGSPESCAEKMRGELSAAILLTNPQNPNDPTVTDVLNEVMRRLNFIRNMAVAYEEHIQRPEVEQITREVVGPRFDMAEEHDGINQDIIAANRLEQLHQGLTEWREDGPAGFLDDLKSRSMLTHAQPVLREAADALSAATITIGDAPLMEVFKDQSDCAALCCALISFGGRLEKINRGLINGPMPRGPGPVGA